MGDQFPTDQKGCLRWTLWVSYQCPKVFFFLNKYTLLPRFLAQPSGVFIHPGVTNVHLAPRQIQVLAAIV